MQDASIGKVKSAHLPNTESVSDLAEVAIAIDFIELTPPTDVIWKPASDEKVPALDKLMETAR